MMAEKVVADQFDCFLRRYQQQVDTRTWQIVKQRITEYNIKHMSQEV